MIAEYEAVFAGAEHRLCIQTLGNEVPPHALSCRRKSPLSGPSQPLYRPCGPGGPDGGLPCEKYRTLPGAAGSWRGGLPGTLSNPVRKTAFDLIAVEKGPLLINMDAQAPNKVFLEWAAAGNFLTGLTVIRPEYVWEDSRFDFLLEDAQGKIFVEVKGVTLEEDGEVRFPDAPTERGVKHLRGLRRAVEQGYRAAVFFVVQMKGVTRFRPNDKTHPAFGDALREAAGNGVGVYAYDCRVAPDSLELDAPVEVDLSYREER